MEHMRKNRAQRIGALIIIAVLLVLVVGLVLFIRHRLRYAVTNAVFVETDRLVYLSFPRVNGRLLKTLKNEGKRVREGELVALLDSSAYEEELKAVRAELLALRKKKEALRIEIDRLEKEIRLRKEKIEKELLRLKARQKALRAKQQVLLAEIAQVQRDQARYKRLVEKDLAPRRRLEGLETDLKKLRHERDTLIFEEKAVRRAQEALKKELLLTENQKKLVWEKKKALKALKAREKALKARVSTANLLLSYCKLLSPLSGYVAKRFHVAGDVVGPGEPIYALVDPKDIYILVLLEETKLKGVQVGSYARIRIDAFPDEKFEGKVWQILPATAAKFALVPRDISAGEFTKVAQRVPVKIKITRGPVELLRVGLGGEVEIRRQ